jgi:hypothetical protein
MVNNSNIQSKELAVQRTTRRLIPAPAEGLEKTVPGSKRTDLRFYRKLSRKRTHIRLSFRSRFLAVLD